jgi:hypothetical protein
VTRELAVALGLAERLLALDHLLDVLARVGRRVEEQRAGGAGAAVLPGMRHAARKEGAGAGAAGEQLVADLEAEFAIEHPDDLVAVVVEVVPALGAGGHGFLEHHDAPAGLVTRQFQRKQPTGRVRVVLLPAAGGYDEPFGGHEGLPSLRPAKNRPATGQQPP